MATDQAQDYWKACGIAADAQSKTATAIPCDKTHFDTRRGVPRMRDWGAGNRQLARAEATAAASRATCGNTCGFSGAEDTAKRVIFCITPTPSRSITAHKVVALHGRPHHRQQLLHSHFLLEALA